MPLRRTRQIQSRRTPNRSWSGFASTTTTTVSASAKVLLGGFTLSNPGIDETILRTVGVLGVRTDQTSATELQIGALGLIVVNDLAVAAGAASIPGPITDRGDDGWFLYVPIVQGFQFATAVGFDARNMTQYMFDSKAKRKVQDGFQIAIMVENASSADGFNIASVFRLLSQVTGT